MEFLIGPTAFRVTTATTVVLTFVLLVLNIHDVAHTRREKINGAIRFMTLDNMRHQAGLMVLACIMLWVSWQPLLLYPTLSCLIAWGMVIDVIFSLIRRRTMEILVAEYLHTRVGVPGGRRKMDPK